MKINHISNNSFGALKINIDKKILNSPKIKKEFEQIRKIITDNRFNRKRNVNVILTHEEGKGFLGIIESKKQGIPNNPGYIHSISSKKKDIKSFAEWLNNWNYLYSPKGLKEWENIKKEAAAVLQKRHQIMSIWRI